METEMRPNGQYGHMVTYNLSRFRNQINKQIQVNSFRQTNKKRIKEKCLIL